MGLCKDVVLEIQYRLSSLWFESPLRKMATVGVVLKALADPRSGHGE